MGLLKKIYRGLTKDFRQIHYDSIFQNSWVYLGILYNDSDKDKIKNLIDKINKKYYRGYDKPISFVTHFKKNPKSKEIKLDNSEPIPQVVSVQYDKSIGDNKLKLDGLSWQFKGNNPCQLKGLKGTIAEFEEYYDYLKKESPKGLSFIWRLDISSFAKLHKSDLKFLLEEYNIKSIPIKSMEEIRKIIESEFYQ